MDFLHLVTEQRYSVRSFEPKKVEQEKLDIILEAGRVAPTAANFQPQRILVLDREDSLEKLKNCTRFHFNAPLALLICYDADTCWKHKQSGKSGGEVDTAIVTTHMMLAAASIGVGSTWIGGFDHEKIRTAFDLPDYLEPVAVLPLGYPAKDAEPNAWHFKRFARSHTVFFNTFEGISKGEPH